MGSGVNEIPAFLLGAAFPCHFPHGKTVLGRKEVGSLESGSQCMDRYFYTLK